MDGIALDCFIFPGAVAFMDVVWGCIVKMRWSASGVMMMITDLKNGLLAHLLLHELMNTRDESLLQILFAKRTIGSVLPQNLS